MFFLLQQGANSFREKLYLRLFILLQELTQCQQLVGA